MMYVWLLMLYSIYCNIKNFCSSFVTGKIFMADLRRRCGHYIFALWFLLSFFSSPNLSGRRVDVRHAHTHGVALVRI